MLHDKTLIFGLDPPSPLLKNGSCVPVWKVSRMFCSTIYLLGLFWSPRCLQYMLLLCRVCPSHLRFTSNCQPNQCLTLTTKGEERLRLLLQLAASMASCMCSVCMFVRALCKVHRSCSLTCAFVRITANSVADSRKSLEARNEASQKKTALLWGEALYRHEELVHSELSTSYQELYDVIKLPLQWERISGIFMTYSCQIVKNLSTVTFSSSG